MIQFICYAHYDNGDSVESVSCRIGADSKREAISEMKIQHPDAWYYTAIEWV